MCLCKPACWHPEAARALRRRKTVMLLRPPFRRLLKDSDVLGNVANSHSVSIPVVFHLLVSRGPTRSPPPQPCPLPAPRNGRLRPSRCRHQRLRIPQRHPLPAQHDRTLRRPLPPSRHVLLHRLLQSLQPPQPNRACPLRPRPWPRLWRRLRRPLQLLHQHCSLLFPTKPPRGCLPLRTLRLRPSPSPPQCRRSPPRLSPRSQTQQGAAPPPPRPACRPRQSPARAPLRLRVTRVAHAQSVRAGGVRRGGAAGGVARAAGSAGSAGATGLLRCLLQNLSGPLRRRQKRRHGVLGTRPIGLGSIRTIFYRHTTTHSRAVTSYRVCIRSSSGLRVS